MKGDLCTKPRCRRPAVGPVPGSDPHGYPWGSEPRCLDHALEAARARAEMATAALTALEQLATTADPDLGVQLRLDQAS